MQIAQKLYEKHIILSAIRPPTVPQNQSRLRLTISASHTQEDLNFVITELIKLL
ncbi:aminotransferase class I/II-fold pyridoxal phosphate-dependent enzyme [Megamonas funiformis]|uniref:aminotransferase class I/II-fold pyridoxal phosphate-dependent enzyme n=1 Tax=Megamonas funiformis TaxID=437897 RepID=UPI002FDCFA7F